jgi:quercetin dioxygenase-like cupin family protein
MNRVDFEKKLQAEGYGEMVDREMEADHFNPEHTHEFDACVLVVEGEMTIARHGKPETLRAGDICSMPAGTLHTEKCGPAGVRYLAGRRHPAQAAAD